MIVKCADRLIRGDWILNKDPNLSEFVIDTSITENGLVKCELETGNRNKPRIRYHSITEQFNVGKSPTDF